MPVEKKEDIKAAVEQAIQPIMDQIDAGDFQTKDEALKAMAQSLEAACEKPGMKGLGTDNKMDMPEPMPGEGEGGEEE